jgi:hypothetical protein
LNQIKKANPEKIKHKEIAIAALLERQKVSEAKTHPLLLISTD